MGRHLPVIILLALTVMVTIALQNSGALHASVQDGLDWISGSVDVPTGDPREEVEDTLRFLVSFLALAAVIAIIAAGVVFVVGGASDTAVQRGRKIIIYTIIGLAIVFFARVIVAFFTQELPT